MKTHYRRISKTALATFLKPEGASLGDAGAVKVGIETPGGWTLLHVNGEDREGLPGKHVSDSFGGLKGPARKAVHRARVRKTVKDGEDNDVVTVVEIPENEVTEDYLALPAEGPQVEEGDAVLAVGINPHRFI